MSIDQFTEDSYEQALQVVMEQCNKWADDESNVVNMEVEYPPYQEPLMMAAEPIE